MAGINTITEFVRLIIEKHGDKPVFLYKSGFRTETWTYSYLYEIGFKILTFLFTQGLGKGDKVVIYAPNTPWWAAVYLACAVSGIIVVPLDFNSNVDFVKKVAGITKPKLLFTVKTTPKTGIRTIYFEDLPEAVRQLKPQRFRDAVVKDDVVEIVFTSGTTGNPKGVIITQYNLVSNIRALRQIMPLPVGTTFLSTLPLSHMLEQTLGLLGPLRFGCTIVYLQTKSSLAIVEAMHQYNVTAMVTVPIFLKLLKNNILRQAQGQVKEQELENALNFAEKLPMFARKLLFRPIHSQLGGRFKFFFVGGAPLEPEIESFWEKLGIPVLQGYGLTEASPVITCNTFTHHRKGSVGKPLPNVHVQLGEDNEVIVKGPNVTKGYYENSAADTQAFEKGWFKTGDVGEFDSSGYLYIKGRKKNMIVTSSGQKVYPEDIEAVLNSTGGIRDSCAVQIGERIIAAVLLQRDAKIKANHVLNDANVRLSASQQISDLIIWSGADFPRTPTLKIIRSKVVEALASKVSTPKEEKQENKLIDILKKLSGKQSIKEHSQLGRDLHLSSLDRVELLAIIADEFGVELEESAIMEHTTIAMLRKSIEHSSTEIKGLPFHAWALNPATIAFRTLLQHLLFIIVRFFAKIKYEGKGNLNGLALPVIFMSNHTSHLDTPAILAGLPGKIRRRVAVAAAMDYFFGTNGPPRSFYSLFVTLFLNAYPFSRDKTHFIRKSLSYTGLLLDKGFSILIYPEGTRNSTEKMGQLKTGAGLLAAKMNVQIVPVRVKNMDKILPKGAHFPKFGVASVSFGSPITIGPNTSYIAATKKIEKEILKL